MERKIWTKQSWAALEPPRKLWFGVGLSALGDRVDGPAEATVAVGIGLAGLP